MAKCTDIYTLNERWDELSDFFEGLKDGSLNFLEVMNCLTSDEEEDHQFHVVIHALREWLKAAPDAICHQCGSEALKLFCCGTCGHDSFCEKCMRDATLCNDCYDPQNYVCGGDLRDV